MSTDTPAYRVISFARSHEFLNTNADTVDIMTDELCHENRLVSKVFTDKEYVF